MKRHFFVDKDPKCQPDFVVDFRETEIQSQNKFQRLIFVNSSRMILQIYNPIKMCEELLPLPMKNIRELLIYGGYLYVTNCYSCNGMGSKQNQTFIDDISAFGFEFIGKENPLSSNEMYVFRLV